MFWFSAERTNLRLLVQKRILNSANFYL